MPNTDSLEYPALQNKELSNQMETSSSNDQHSPEVQEVQTVHLQSKQPHSQNAPIYQPTIHNHEVQPSDGEQVYHTAIPLTNLQTSAAPVDCPSCKGRHMTKVEFVPGNTTLGWALGLCLCFCLGCIPYCVSGSKDVEHRCNNCNVHLATWHRSGRTEVLVHG